MKIRLLNDGLYGGMGAVDFPVVVEGVSVNGGEYFLIRGAEIIRLVSAAGCDKGQWVPEYEYSWMPNFGEAEIAI